MTTTTDEKFQMYARQLRQESFTGSKPAFQIAVLEGVQTYLQDSSNSRDSKQRLIGYLEVLDPYAKGDVLEGLRAILANWNEAPL